MAAAAEYPHAGQTLAIGKAERVAAGLDAELGWFHFRQPDPAALPRSLRMLVGTGLQVVPRRVRHLADRDHFEATMPDRCQQLRELLEPLQVGAEAAVVAQDLGMAWSVSRRARAWGADAALAFGASSPGFALAVAAHLLGLPLVLWLDSLPARSAWPWRLAALAALADTILVPDAASREALAGGQAGRVVERVAIRQGDEASALATARLRQPRSRPATGVAARGPASAFRTRRRDAPQADGARLFVIVCAERTGSNLLLDLLNRHEGVHCVGEAFNLRFLDDGRMPWLERGDGDLAGLRRLRAADPAGLLARLRDDATARGLRSVGLKVMYGHAMADNRLVDALLDDPRLQVVHLRRDDRLARHVSMLRAERSDEWFRTGSQGSAPVEPLVLEARSVAEDLAQVEFQEQWCEATFAAHQILELRYEDLVADRTAVVHGLAAFLGFEPRRVPTQIAKQGPDRADLGIENLAELGAAFAGTRWARLFEGRVAQGPHRAAGQGEEAGP